ncbi:MAG: WecB/TagA/CpsF family glycosyltransferase [Spirulinaceae cyanobacterium]
MQKSSVLGIPIHVSNDYVGWLASRIEENRGNHVVTLNAEMVMEAEKDQSLGEIIHTADLVIPDGAGVVLYLRLRGKSPQQKRCPGIELAQSLITKMGQKGEACPIVFYGGASGITEKAAQIWRQKVRGISITTNHGFLCPEEQQQWQQTLQQLQPKIILVGLGVPRQEVWIKENRHLCPQATWIGVGGSFDIWAGVKSRAPGWLRNNNLEWLYRLYKEPWRWRRMLVLPQFALKALVKG